MSQRQRRRVTERQRESQTFVYQKHGKRNSTRKLNCIKIYSVKRQCRCDERKRKRYSGNELGFVVVKCKTMTDDFR